VAIPTAYGGKTREVQIDLDPQALQEKKLSAQDVANALAQQNQIIPAGTEKIGRFEYNIKLNNSPLTLQELNALPIKTVDGATIYIRDVAHVRDGYPPQTNIVRVDGHRAVLMSILKNGSASTLDIIAGVKANAALVGRNLAGQLSDQRGLAGTVRADKRVQLAARKRERNAVGGQHTAEALGQTFDFKNRFSHGARPRAIHRCRR